VIGCLTLLLSLVAVGQEASIRSTRDVDCRSVCGAGHARELVRGDAVRRTEFS
jgi:hypothetical protein